MLLRAYALHRTRTVFFPTLTRALGSAMAQWSATCLSSETADTNLSVLIDCDASRFLFNCGEGTTRAMLQGRKGFRKFKAIFTSGVDTERTSGLPGFLMTLADSGTTKINVFGPPGLNHFLASTRLYTMRESISLKLHEISTSSHHPVYSDDNLSIFAVPVLPEEDIPPDLTDLPSTENSLKRKRNSDSDIQLRPNKKEKFDPSGNADLFATSDTPVGTLAPSAWNLGASQPSDLTGIEAITWRKLVIPRMFSGTSTVITEDIAAVSAEKSSGQEIPNFVISKQFHKRLPRMDRPSVTLSYIILGALGRGKFDVAKATALGIKAGPARGKLAKGETVVSPEGKTITPDMVLGNPPRPEAMIFIDCPTPGHIESLVRSESFKSYQKGGEYPPHCIIHLAGPGVLEDIRYQQWLGTFGDAVHHLVTGPNRTPDKIKFTSSAYAQLRLSHLDRDIFRVPKTLASSVTTLDGAALIGVDASKAVTGPLKFESLKSNHFVAMKPAQAPLMPEDNGIDLFHPAIQKGGAGEITSILQPKTVDVFTKARMRVAEEQVQRRSLEQPGDDVVVTPLGTSSAMPSKYRNVSALILQIPGSGYMLLDCGEGTLGQMRRHFGDNAHEVLRDMRCIFISHIHGDHHIGLSKLLSQRRKLEPPCTSPIYLITNEPIYMYLQEYNDLEDLGLEDHSTGVRIIYSEHAHVSRQPFRLTGTLLDEKSRVESLQNIDSLNSDLHLASISTVDVWHKGRCYGIVIKHQDGWSVVYSGDTRPTETLVRAGRNATLLIHEATLADDQVEMAAAKGHSTIGQAIDIAKRMRAKTVLLTHFSNRFPKTPQMSNGPIAASDPVIAVAFDHASISIRDMWKMERYLTAVEQSFLDSEDPEDEVVDSLASAP